jgi:putative PIN family toxin of toxin-antitoxin system
MPQVRLCQTFSSRCFRPWPCVTIGKVRVVLDTNILVSACWKPAGLEAQVVDLALTGQITICVSTVILAEYRDVLSRPKLAAVGTRTAELLAALERVAVSVEPTTCVQASIDDDDNRFLECAEQAHAAYLITGNLRHYPEVWAGALIVNARAFLSHPLQ